MVPPAEEPGAAVDHGALIPEASINFFEVVNYLTLVDSNPPENQVIATTDLGRLRPEVTRR
jgi:hypothetical protein